MVRRRYTSKCARDGRADFVVRLHRHFLIEVGTLSGSGTRYPRCEACILCFSTPVRFKQYNISSAVPKAT